MTKNLSVMILILSLFLLTIQSASLFAEEKTEASSLLTLGAKSQNVYGTVGKVDYVDFKSRGESKVVLKTNKGEVVEISLRELKNEARVLATFRKETDKKGREKNVLVSLSIVKTAKEAQK